MSNPTCEQNRLLSHNTSSEDMATTVQKIAERIKAEGDKPHVTVQRQLTLLNELAEFDLGRYLLQNKGLNGYWIHYLLMHPRVGQLTGTNNRGEPLLDLERFMLETTVTAIATQERFEIFLKENQKSVVDGATLASVPSGLLGELLYLDFKGVKNIRLIGIDYDKQTLDDAKGLTTQRGLTHKIDFIQRDAWALNIKDELDLISSNGLNIYEPDDDKVTALYRQFLLALKRGGKLVTSFLTYPPGMSETCEWDMAGLNPQHALLARILFIDIIQANWQCYRTTEQTRMQLSSVGFRDIKFVYDSRRIFPTVTAIKM